MLPDVYLRQGLRVGRAMPLDQVVGQSVQGVRWREQAHVIAPLTHGLPAVFDEPPSIDLTTVDQEQHAVVFLDNAQMREHDRRDENGHEGDGNAFLHGLVGVGLLTSVACLLRRTRGSQRHRRVWGAWWRAMLANPLAWRAGAVGTGWLSWRARARLVRG